MSLTVSVAGANQREVFAKARERGAAWYEVDSRCIGATILEVEEETTVVGSREDVAAYRAQVKTTVAHAWSRPTTGFPRCRNCGVTDYGR